MASTKTFGTKSTAEEIVYGIDFADRLDTGDSLSAANTWTVTVRQGTDGSPSSILSGGPSISGTVISQKIVGGEDNVRYELRATADTTNGEVLAGCGVLHVTDTC